MRQPASANAMHLLCKCYGFRAFIDSRARTVRRVWIGAGRNVGVVVEPWWLGLVGGSTTAKGAK